MCQLSVSRVVLALFSRDAQRKVCITEELLRIPENKAPRADGGLASRAHHPRLHPQQASFATAVQLSFGQGLGVCSFLSLTREGSARGGLWQIRDDSVWGRDEQTNLGRFVKVDWLPELVTSKFTSMEDKFPTWNVTVLLVP